MKADQANTTRVSWRDGAAHACLLGPVNHDTTPGLQQRLDEALRTPCCKLVLDLCAADYVDSDGVRWLQGLQQELFSRGVEMRLAVRAGSKADRTLALLRLEQAFAIERYPSETAAPVLGAVA